MVVVRLKKEFKKEVLDGSPWVMTHMAVESSQWQVADAGLARVEDERGAFIGIGMLNPKSHIVCRMLTRKEEAIDRAFFERLFARAMRLREALYDAPFYRLVHSEADFLPGLVIDRYDDLLVLQVSSAGMEHLQPIWLEALDAVLPAKTWLLRNDIGARKPEGLEQFKRIIKGKVPKLTELRENGCIYLADVMEGQKTGWFFDMRDNRKRVAELAVDKTVLDVFSHSGGFGVLCATMGAKHVTMADASALALSLAMEAAARNKVENICETLKGDAVSLMHELAQKGARYEVVIADPPAYVKSKKDVASGMKGYSKVAQAAAGLVAEGGILFTASCSHHASRKDFNKAVLDGIKKAGRRAVILGEWGASADHPSHPKLPQNSYLKGLLLQFV